MKNNTGSLVSIIIPVYNAEEYIGTCMESLLKQTYNNIEIIVVNDGSVDGSENVIMEYCKKNNRIIYKKKENEGVSKARNYGISIAQGTYLTFVDADDWVSTNFIEEAITMLETYDLDFVHGGTEKVYASGTQNCTAKTSEDIIIYDKRNPVLAQKVLSNGVTSDRRLNPCFTSGTVCKVFRKEITEGQKFDETLTIGEDTVFNMNILEHTNRVGVVPKVWYYYRMNEVSATKRYNPAVDKRTEKLMQVLAEGYGDNPQFVDFLTVRAAQQFYGMLIIGILNEQSHCSIFKKIKTIKEYFNQPIWKKMFAHAEEKKLPANKLDKIFIWLCKHRYAFLTICFVNLRLSAKKLSRRN